MYLGCVKLLIAASFHCTVLLQQYLTVCNSAAVGKHKHVACHMVTIAL